MLFLGTVNKKQNLNEEGYFQMVTDNQQAFLEWAYHMVKEIGKDVAVYTLDNFVSRDAHSSHKFEYLYTLSEYGGDVQYGESADYCVKKDGTIQFHIEIEG